MEQITETANDAVSPHNKKIPHSPSYPSVDFNEIVEFISRIYTLLGYTQYHDKELIAKALGFAWSSIKMKISTAVQYGLLELKHGVGYKITQLFLQIHKPVSEDEKRSSSLQALRNPDLYSRLIDEYNNDVLPSVNVLSTILFRRYGITEKVAGKAAEIFILNVKALELLTSDNRLNFAASIGNQIDDDLVIETESVSKPKELPAPVYSSQIIQNDFIEIPIPLKSGKKAFLKIPEDFSAEDVERVSKFVDALK